MSSSLQDDEEGVTHHGAWTAFKTAGVGRIAARVIEQLVVREPLTMRTLIDETRPCRWFA